jgi:hypothetical protein
LGGVMLAKQNGGGAEAQFLKSGLVRLEES